MCFEDDLVEVGDHLGHSFINACGIVSALLNYCRYRVADVVQMLSKVNGHGVIGW